jgi:hexosaminidase
MKKLAAAVFSVLSLSLLLALLAVPASAQQYPPGGTTCGVGATSLGPGDQITVSGSGWQPGSTVTFTLQPGSIPLGSTTVGDDGSFSTVLTVPASVAPGSYSLSCSGIDVEGNPISRNNPIQVLAAGGGGGAAFTGNTLNVPLWMALVAGLLASGVLLVVLGGRRRRSVRAGP